MVSKLSQRESVSSLALPKADNLLRVDEVGWNPLPGAGDRERERTLLEPTADDPGLGEISRSTEESPACTADPFLAIAAALACLNLWSSWDVCGALTALGFALRAATIRSCLGVRVLGLLLLTALMAAEVAMEWIW